MFIFNSEKNNAVISRVDTYDLSPAPFILSPPPNHWEKPWKHGSPKILIPPTSMTSKPIRLISHPSPRVHHLPSHFPAKTISLRSHCSWWPSSVPPAQHIQENAVDWFFGCMDIIWRFMDAWELIKVSHFITFCEAQTTNHDFRKIWSCFFKNGQYRAVRITCTVPAFPPLRCRSYSAPALSRSYWLPTHQQRPAENTALKAQDLPQNLRPNW